MRKRLDDNRVLDMWFGGESTESIRRAVGATHINTVQKIVSRARAVGDKRAIYRGGQRSVTVREAVTSSIKTFNRKRIASKHRPTEAELSAAIAAYQGPITKLPAGIHVGWRPRWA